MERAKRLEEIPLLKEQHEVLKLERKEVWEEQEEERILKEKEQREKDVENKKRMIRQGNPFIYPGFISINFSINRHVLSRVLSLMMKLCLRRN